MYKGVIKVVSQNSSVRVGNLSCKGKALEYAVKMREIPQEYRMDDLIKADKVSLKTIEKLARISVKFHSSARTSPKITNYWRSISIRKKVDENFQTFAKLNNEMSGHKLSKIHKVHKN